jgi:hypothetical protein
VISVRRSGTGENTGIKKIDPAPKDGQIRPLLDEFLKGQDPTGVVLLVGGADILHFRLRVAQSVLRSELTPSTWSHAGLLERSGNDVVVREVPLDPPSGFQDMPRCNGIHTVPLSRYDHDPRKGKLFPNVALLRFPIHSGDLPKAIERIRFERGMLDLVSAIPPWLGYTWGTNASTNPLTNGLGLPAAVFIEAAFAALGVDLTPGLATRSSCPEAIWQAARYWHEFFQDQAQLDAEATRRRTPLGAVHPTGIHWVRQPYAAFMGPDEIVLRAND